MPCVILQSTKAPQITHVRQQNTAALSRSHHFSDIWRMRLHAAHSSQPNSQFRSFGRSKSVLAPINTWKILTARVSPRAGGSVLPAFTYLPEFTKFHWNGKKGIKPASSHHFTNQRIRVLVPTFHSTPTYPGSDSKGRSFGTPTIKQNAAEMLGSGCSNPSRNRAGAYSVSATKHVASVPNRGAGVSSSWWRSFTLRKENVE